MKYIYLIYYIVLLLYVLYHFIQSKNKKISHYIKDKINKVNDDRFFKLQFQSSIITAILSCVIYTIIFYGNSDNSFKPLGIVILLIVFYYTSNIPIFVGEQEKYIN